MAVNLLAKNAQNARGRTSLSGGAGRRASASGGGSGGGSGEAWGVTCSGAGWGACGGPRSGGGFGDTSCNRRGKGPLARAPDLDLVHDSLPTYYIVGGAMVFFGSCHFLSSR
jgi:hypothetical protein